MTISSVHLAVSLPTPLPKRPDSSSLHCEIKNHLSLVTGSGFEEKEHRNLADIEWDVLRELIGTNSYWKGNEDDLVNVALTIRDQVLKGDVDGEELLALLGLTHH